MQIEWQALDDRRAHIEAQLTEPHLSHAERGTLQKELSRIRMVLAKYKDIEELSGAIAHAQKEKNSIQDPDMVDLYTQEIESLQKQVGTIEQQLEDLMLPKSPHDDRSVFLEIRAGAGGQEAALFAADLVKMYSNYALKKGWRASIVDQSLTDLGGIRDVVLHIEGKDVYGHLKFEAGVHRVQRVPKTETAGRVHTSTATVAVLPEAQDVDVTINPADLRIDVFRASGAGGQHVNTTDSAVRITHIPSGVVVSCQDERSQHKNKAKAMKMLQSRILAHEMEKHAAQISQQRKEMVGSGARAEKVRTYNFPQNRVTDHQVELTLKNLDYVIEGNIEEIIEALRVKDKQERKKQAMKV